MQYELWTNKNKHSFWRISGSWPLLSKKKFMTMKIYVKSILAFTLLWRKWQITNNNNNKHWQEARSQCPLPSLCFWGRSKNQDDCPGLLLSDIFSTSALRLLNGFRGNLTGSKILTSSTKFVFFRPNWKPRYPPPPASDWMRYFQILLWIAERNSTKLDRKQDLYQVCVFGPIRKPR